MKIKSTIAVVLALLYCLFPLPGFTVEVYDTISPINITVGYHRSASDTDSDTKHKIEMAFEYMDFAIREMTNGAHRLGQVRIIHEPREYFHIDWLNYHAPGADAAAGTYVPFGQSSNHRRSIKIGDNFVVRLAANSPEYYDSAKHSQIFGVTLAHEAGHFIYGLGDEFDSGPWGYEGLPEATIMRNQLEAVFFGDLNALNFSTMWNYRARPMPRTQQRSFYPRSISAWSTLASDYSSPLAVIQRSKFEDLVAVAPPPNAPAPHYHRYFPESLPRTLDIRWGPPKRARKFLLDVSRGMLGRHWFLSVYGGWAMGDIPVPVDGLLRDGNRIYTIAVGDIVREIAEAPPGMNLAVYAFADNFMPFLRWHEIPEDDTIVDYKKMMVREFLDKARNRHSELYYGNSLGAAIFRNIYELIPRLNDHMEQRDIVVGDVYVLTAGGNSNNRGTTSDNVIRKSRDYFIPVHFDFTPITFLAPSGTALIPVRTLEVIDYFRDLAKNVGGALDRFFTGGDNLRRVTRLAYREPHGTQSIIDIFREVQSRRNRGMSRTLSDENDVKFFIDESLVYFSVFISHDYAEDDLEFSLISPANTEHPLTLLYYDEVLGSGFLAHFTINDSIVGEWTLKSVNNTDSNITVHISVRGNAIVTSSAQNDVRHSVTVGQSIHNIINLAENAPRTITFMTLYGGELLTNLDIEVTVEDEYGNIFRLHPRDDGTGPDIMANDGIFTATIPSLRTGVYLLTSRINNRAGQAYITRVGALGVRFSEDLDGPSPFFGEPIKENFERTVTIVYEVVNDPENANVRQFSPRGSSPFDNPDANFQIGGIDGVEQMLLGIEREFSVNFYPQEMGNLLRNHISWNLDAGNDARMTTDPERPGVVRVRFDSHNNNANLSISNVVPNALRRFIMPQTRSLRLVTAEPLFLGAGLDRETENITILEGEEAFFDMSLILPRGYDDSATWSITSNPDNAGQIVNQRADGVTFRTLRPGRFTMTLTSDVWPQLINRSVEVHSVFREMPGSQPGRPGDDAFGPNPIPGRPDPGGDDDVRTRPDTGNDGGNGGGPSRDPEYQDPQDPVLLPPELSRITLGGRDITDDGVRLIRQWETVPLVLEFRESIDRYMLSAAFMSGTNSPHDATSATSTINNIALSEDGKTLAYEFMGKVPGQHRVFFNVERKDGIEAAGSFVLHVKPSPNLGGQGGPEEGEQGNEGSGGGGCNAGAGALAAMLVLAVAVWKIRKS